jgi:hypothetical protein
LWFFPRNGLSVPPREYGMEDGGKRRPSFVSEVPQLADVMIDYNALKHTLKVNPGAFEEEFTTALATACENLALATPVAVFTSRRRSSQVVARPPAAIPPALYQRAAILGLGVLKILKARWVGARIGYYVVPPHRVRSSSGQRAELPDTARGTSLCMDGCFTPCLALAESRQARPHYHAPAPPGICHHRRDPGVPHGTCTPVTAYP